MGNMRAKEFVCSSRASTKVVCRYSLVPRVLRIFFTLREHGSPFLPSYLNLILKSNEYFLFPDWLMTSRFRV